MIIKFFLAITDYPAVRRIIWKPFYEILAKRFKVKDWSFMNYGYHPSPNEDPLKLDAQDEINRYSIQMYHYLMAKITVAGKDILEVGSGRGGGANYIKRRLYPEKIIGLDIAGNAVSMANEQYESKSIRFVQGTAEKLPFEEETFDVVVNIESSHTYGSVPRFLAEVKRVLRTGGYFLLADFRAAKPMMELKKILCASGMQLILEEDISRNVYHAIELEENIKQARIKENIPPWMQKTFKEFAGVIGGKVHRELNDGSLKYHRFILQK